MIFILPLITANAVMDWRTPPLSGLLENMVRKLVSLSSPHEAWFLTDSSKMEALVRKVGTSSVLRMESAGEAVRNEQIADRLAEHFGIETQVAVLDHRNPLLTPSVLMRAVAHFLEDSRSPLVSTVIPTDHPVQLRTFYNVADVGMIHLLDGEPKAIENLSVPFRSAHAVTKTFPFDWRIIESGSESVAFMSGENGLVPLGPDNYESWSEVWIKESPTTARIALEKEVSSEACGFVSSSVKSNRRVFLSREGGELFLHSEENDNSMMQLIPFTSEGLVRENSMHVSLQSVKTRLGEFDGQVAGFAYVVQQSAPGGQYTHESLFSPANGCWCARTQRANDGCKISGRQRFPSIFQVDPSLFVGTVKQMRHLDELLSTGDVRGFELGSHACLIEKPLDVLRYSARSRYVNGGGDHDA